MQEPVPPLTNTFHPSRFVLYVNNHRVITDVTANDGYWHHVCLTWSSAGGRWSIIRDGKLVEGGVGLASGFVIPANGTLVLGQEQDRNGGGFSIAESFVGQLTQVNVWSRVISPAEATKLLTDCSFQFGDVVAWTDFLKDLRGRVWKNDSAFCHGTMFVPLPLEQTRFYTT